MSPRHHHPHNVMVREGGPPTTEPKSSRVMTPQIDEGPSFFPQAS
jgi:hypothetical protein